jgi:5-methylcytosine-specific restriction endonuclease McrBC GTP-binding regulatory subunit McrB
MDKVYEIINRRLKHVYTIITRDEFNSIVSLMGSSEVNDPEQPEEFIELDEVELLDYIKSYIAAKGYYFDEETIYNYHICLKTRPFVILAGLSGTGKSKLSQLYAEALGHTVQNKHYLRLAVRPNWNDDRYLLGYLNSITGKYVTEPAVDFIMKAGEDEKNLYFLCLDEMNLAHVEYYFSQFLSALEEDNPLDRWIPLQSEQEILIPSNLLFTGTINVDETTQPLSDKVIDRANTIEFFSVELDKIPERKPLPNPLIVSSVTWHNYTSNGDKVRFVW